MLFRSKVRGQLEGLGEASHATFERNTHGSESEGQVSPVSEREVRQFGSKIYSCNGFFRIGMFAVASLAIQHQTRKLRTLAHALLHTDFEGSIGHTRISFEIQSQARSNAHLR